MKAAKNLGLLLLGIWLVVSGLISILSLSFSGMHILMAVLALAAGVLLIVGR
jgi:hypothetical protein